MIVVGGPTASRKSELALGLAARYDGSLICCDSVQIYRGFRIGAASPGPDDLAAAPHHLYGVLEATDPADAARYAVMADAAIATVRGEGRTPIVVGGTGLYLRALLWGLAPIPPVPAATREAIAEEHARDGIAPLWARLIRLDPAMETRIQGGPANTQRVLRALEVVEGTGERLSALQDAHEPALRYRPTILVPGFDRPALVARIEARVDRMIAAGLIHEVAGLLADGVPRDCRPMMALGYRQIAAHLAGEHSLESAITDVKRGHRRYARRQRTWFERVALTTWLDGASDTLVDDASEHVDAVQRHDL